MCDSIKHNFMLAELWSDRSKGWLWAWSWSWSWPHIRWHLCDGEQRHLVTLKWRAAQVTWRAGAAVASKKGIIWRVLEGGKTDHKISSEEGWLSRAEEALTCTPALILCVASFETCCLCVSLWAELTGSWEISRSGYTGFRSEHYNFYFAGFWKEDKDLKVLVLRIMCSSAEKDVKVDFSFLKNCQYLASYKAAFWAICMIFLPSPRTKCAFQNMHFSSWFISFGIIIWLEALTSLSQTLG